MSLLLTSGSVAGALVMDATFGKGIFSFSGVSKSISNATQQISNTNNSKNNNNSTSSSFISSYVPEPVNSAFSWISEQLPSSDWHNQNNGTTSVASSTSGSIGGGDDGEGLTSKVSQLLGFGEDGVKSNVIMMGISSAAFSVVGYNLAFNPRTDSFISAFMLVGHTILSELTARSAAANNGNNNINNKNAKKFSAADDTIITAHAAHIGGFCWGMLFGYVCRRIEKRRRDAFAFQFNENNLNINENGRGGFVEDDRGNRGRVLGVGRR